MERWLLGSLQTSASTWSASCVNQALRLASEARRAAGACGRRARWKFTLGVAHKSKYNLIGMN